MSPFRIARRSVAGFLCLALVLGSLESAVADVHDGDASAAELADAGPAPAVCGAALYAHDDAPARDGAGHAHVCHAGHAHVISPPAASPALSVTGAFSSPPERASPKVVDFQSPPDVPPPVA